MSDNERHAKLNKITNCQSFNQLDSIMIMHEGQVRKISLQDFTEHFEHIGDFVVNDGDLVAISLQKNGTESSIKVDEAKLNEKVFEIKQAQAQTNLSLSDAKDDFNTRITSLREKDSSIETRLKETKLAYEETCKSHDEEVESLKQQITALKSSMTKVQNQLKTVKADIKSILEKLNTNENEQED